MTDSRFIVRAMLALGPLDRAGKEDVLRRAVAAAGTFEGEPFYGDDPRSQEFLDGGAAPPDLVVMLRSPFLDRASDEDNGWFTITVSDDGRGQPAYVFVAINVGREQQLELEWRLGLALAPRLVQAVTPSVAFMNGKSIEDEHYRALPPPKDFNRPGPPASITPWTYIERARLQEGAVEQQLAALPVARAERLGAGLVIQVVERLESRAPAAFEEALARIRPRIEYIPPQLKAD